MKKLVTGIICSSILSTCMLPIGALAANSSVTTETSQNIQSDELLTAIDQIGTELVLIQTDALSILKQPNLRIVEHPSLNTHLQAAQRNAQYWLDTLQRDLIDTNQGMISYSQDVASYYDILTSLSSKIATDTQKKQDFLRGLQYIQTSMEDLQENVKKSLINFNTFQTSVKEELHAFSFDIDKTIHTLSANAQEANSNIMSLTLQIQEQRDFIVASHMKRLQDFIMLIKSADSLTGLGKTYGTIISSTVNTFEVRHAGDQIINAQKDINNWVNKLNNIEFHLVNVQFVKQEMDSFLAHIGKGEGILQKMNASLNVQLQQIKQLTSQVEKGEVDSLVLQNKITELQQSAVAIEKHAKQQESALTSVTYQ